MKVRALVKKMGDFGTCPNVFVEANGKQIGYGKPDEVERSCGDMRVESFIATAIGEFIIFASKPT